MRLAYLTPQYPKVSHTFIRREILALEAAGHHVLRLSIREPDAGMTVDAADTAERGKTTFCLAAGPVALVGAVLTSLVKRPAATLRALGHALNLGRSGGRGLVAHLAYWVEACFVRDRLEAERIEHLHVHFGTNAATVALLVRDLGGPPFSITVHGPDEIDAPVGHHLAAKIGAAKFVAGISHYTVAQLRRWVAPDQWRKLSVVRCSVDDAFLDAHSPVPDAAATLVCVGRLCPQKGQLTLVDAFARLAETHPTARLVLAGDGEMRGEVEAAVRAHGLADRVEITGWVDEAAVRQQLRGCRAMVLPSYAEGLPVVLMEALAMGRPVVSTYIAGIPELVRPGENGWLVPSSDVEALGRALHEVMAASSKRLSEMGQRGRDRVRSQHYLPTEAARLADLLTSD